MRKLDLNADLTFILSEADRSLGELAGMARTLSNPQLLIAPLSQREAVLSSRIEGTEASLSELALFEAASDAPVRSRVEVQEVRNYRTAMNYGLERMADLPLSLRLVRELHGKLMAGVRGQEMTPGEFRTSQNWIGTPGCTLNDATYVPPPPYELLNCLGDWEAFLHEEVKLPPLLRCALMHYQFEAIHPFLDGNGRVGRLLIVLFLCTLGRLPAPVLYLSPFFESHRQEYYELLRGVTERSAWNEWLSFFLRAVIVQCKDAFVRSSRMTTLHEEYRQRLLVEKAPPSAHNLLELLFISPATTAKLSSLQLRVTVMSAARAIQLLCDLDILEEVTGRRRDRVYLAQGLVQAIESESNLEDTFANQPTLF
jgi:cell filamentation protein, protein adenylyltransferase